MKTAPFRFDPGSDSLTVFKEYTVKLTYDGEATYNPLPGGDYKIAPPWWGFYDRIIINFDDLSCVLDTTPEEYMVITSDDYLYNDNLLDFINWKKRQGFNVIVKPYATAPDTDDVRNDIIAENPDYVLIAEYIDFIPMYKIISYPDSADTTPTDNYYADIHTGDPIYPDLAIGRFPCGNTTELQTLISKTLTYEKYPLEFWEPERQLFVAGQADASHNFTFDKDNIKGFLTDTVDFIGEIITSYADSGADNTDISTTFNDTSLGGIGIVNYWGHGGMDSGVWTWFGTSAWNCSDVVALNPQSYFPIILSFGCFTGNIDYDTTMAMSWLNTSQKGAAGLLGATREAHSWADSLDYELYRSVFQDSLFSIGIAIMTAKNCFMGFIDERMIFQFYGDPSLDIWTEVEGSLKVTGYPELITPDTSDITLNLNVRDEDSVIVENALVCLWKGYFNNSTAAFEDEIFAVKYSDASGNVSFDIDSADLHLPGWLYITATKHNYIPFEGQICIGYADTVVLDSGYNLLSIPGETGLQKLGDIFDTDSIFKCDISMTGYIKCGDSLNTPGYGFWVWKDNIDTITYPFAPCYYYEREIGSFWNIIGSILPDTTWSATYCFIDSYGNPHFEYLINWNGHTYEYSYDSVSSGKGYYFMPYSEGILSFPDTCADPLGIPEKSIKSIKYWPNPPDLASETGAPLPDTAHFKVAIDWTNNLVLVTDKATGDTLENVLVAFQVGDSVDIQYTDTAGSNNFGVAETDLDIGDNDSTWIVVFYPEYVEYIHHPYGAISNGDTMWGDVYITGDVVAESGDTLTILP